MQTPDGIDSLLLFSCDKSHIENNNSEIHDFVIKHKNTMQRNTRIGSESILAFQCIVWALASYYCGNLHA